MILSGIFDKFPNLKLITRHWGEGIYMMLDRMDSRLTDKENELISHKNAEKLFKL